MQEWSIAKGSKLASILASFIQGSSATLQQSQSTNKLPSSPECNLIENFPYSIIPNLWSNLINYSGLIFFVKYTIDLNKDDYHLL